MMRPQSFIRRARRRGQGGFSLIELLVATGILLLMMAGVFRQISRMQQYASGQETRRDMFANARQLLDQFDRDLRLAGYPNVSQYRTVACAGGCSVNATPDNDGRVAVTTLVSASPTLVMFEGDIEGDGFVQSVAYQYVTVTPAGSTAACKPGCLLRGQVPKATGVAPGAQTTLANMNVVLDNVALPAGATGIFRFYQSNGTEITPGAGGVSYTSGAGCVTGSITDIRMVKVLMNAQAQFLDAQNNTRPMASLGMVSHLNNHCT